MTLTDFLLARIAEDEAVARSATPGPWEHDERMNCGCVQQSGGDYADVAVDTDSRPEDGYHIARWHPARVLAECDAKRRIVEALVDAERAVATYDNDDPNNPPSYWQEWGNRHALKLAVESHATTYADHPDYREGWKP